MVGNNDADFGKALPEAFGSLKSSSSSSSSSSSASFCPPLSLEKAFREEGEISASDSDSEKEEKKEEKEEKEKKEMRVVDPVKNMRMLTSLYGKVPTDPGGRGYMEVFLYDKGARIRVMLPLSVARMIWRRDMSDRVCQYEDGQCPRQAIRMHPSNPYMCVCRHHHIHQPSMSLIPCVEGNTRAYETPVEGCKMRSVYLGMPKLSQELHFTMTTKAPCPASLRDLQRPFYLSPPVASRKGGVLIHVREVCGFPMYFGSNSYNQLIETYTSDKGITGHRTLFLNSKNEYGDCDKVEPDEPLAIDYGEIL